MENTTRNTETRLRLKAGETQLQHALAGTLILVQDGSVWQDSAPRWLGEKMHETRQRLDAGSCLRVEETGWTRLTAERDCALAWITLGTSRACWPCCSPACAGGTFRKIAGWPKR